MDLNFIGMTDLVLSTTVNAASVYPACICPNNNMGHCISELLLVYLHCSYVCAVLGTVMSLS